MRMTAPVHEQVLICLPGEQEALAFLNDVLTSSGFSVTSTASLPEFEDAIQTGGHCAVITVAAMTGPIRAISDLPLVDIHPFSRGWQRSGTRPRHELFDREAFLKSVRFIARGC